MREIYLSQFREIYRNLFVVNKWPLINSDNLSRFEKARVFLRVSNFYPLREIKREYGTERKVISQESLKVYAMSEYSDIIVIERANGRVRQVGGRELSDLVGWLLDDWPR